MPAFKLVGAIFLIYIAGAMLSNNKYPFGGKDDLEITDDISIIPLTFPLLVGPAAISLVIIQSDQIISWEIKMVIIYGPYYPMNSNKYKDFLKIINYPEILVNKLNRLVMLYPLHSFR